MPCFKLGIRFGDPSMVKAFLQAGRPGIYFAVVEEGIIVPGDSIERLHTDENRVSIVAMRALILDRDPAPDALRRVLRVSALAAGWREEFTNRLGASTQGGA
jgi:MOSC domain-containing protein YiiM